MADVTDFGATGDGMTDDWEGLQHALEQGGGVLHLPKGNYRISKPLEIDLAATGYVSIQGEGGTARLIMAGPGPAIRLIGDHNGTALPRTVTPRTWERTRFPTVTGIEIVGAHPEAVGIEAVRTMQCTISGVLIRQCKTAIHLKERNRNFLLADSHLYDNAEYGVFLDTCNLHQINIIGNHISYCYRAGIKVLNGDIHNFQITGNDIEYNNRPDIDTPEEGGAEIDFDVLDGMVSEVTIASNTIQATVQPGGANIRIRGALKDGVESARLIAITGNIIGSQTRVLDFEGAERVTVTGNTIYDGPDGVIRMVGCRDSIVSACTVGWRASRIGLPRDTVLLQDCRGIVLQSLVFDGAGGSEDHPLPVITLAGSQDCAVADCRIAEPASAGIELIDSRACRVYGNAIVKRTAPLEFAIRVQGDGGNNWITGNQVVAENPDQMIVAPEPANRLDNNMTVAAPGE